jgi:hypothetical protein
MIIINKLSRPSASTVVCEIELDQSRKTFIVDINYYDDPLRGMSFRGVTPKQSWELSARDDWKPFLKTIWRYIDGEQLIFPRTIAADDSG